METFSGNQRLSYVVRQCSGRGTRPRCWSDSGDSPRSRPKWSWCTRWWLARSAIYRCTACRVPAPQDLCTSHTVCPWAPGSWQSCCRWWRCCFRYHLHRRRLRYCPHHPLVSLPARFLPPSRWAVTVRRGCRRASRQHHWDLYCCRPCCRDSPLKALAYWSHRQWRRPTKSCWADSGLQRSWPVAAAPPEAGRRSLWGRKAAQACNWDVICERNKKVVKGIFIFISKMLYV